MKKILKSMGCGFLGFISTVHGTIIVLTSIMLLVVSVLAVIVFFSSLGEPDTTQLAKDEFAQYYNGQREVAIVYRDDVYFEDFVLKQEDFEIYHETDSVAPYKNAIYFVGYEADDRVSIYSCDYNGKNTTLIHSQYIGDKKQSLNARFSQGSYYISYITKKDKIKHIDKYTISTGVYENLANGKDLNLYDYLPTEEQKGYPYKIEEVTPSSECKNGKFIITDLNSGEQKIIDDNFLKGTPYIASMEEFGYWVENYTISQGHILLVYGSGAGKRYGKKANVARLVFEYDFNTNTLEYKLLAFPPEDYYLRTYYLG